MNNNAFLHPAYWGSFVAIAISILSIIFSEISSGKFIPNPSNSNLLSIALYLHTLILIISCVCRYYIVISTNSHTSNIDVLKLNVPEVFKRTLFLGLVIILLLANSLSAGLAIFGEEFAYYMCISMIILSLVLNIILYISHSFRVKQIPCPEFDFVLSDAVLLLISIVGLLIFSLAEGSNAPSLFAVLSGMISTITLLLIAHTLKAYGKNIKLQLDDLREHLN